MDHGSEDESQHDDYDDEPYDKLSTLELLSATSSKPLPTYSGTLNGHAVRILIDSGASSLYVSKSFLANKTFTAHQVKPRGVRTANGQVEICNTVVRGQLALGAFRQNISAYAMNLRSFDLILGLAWLHKLGAIVNHSTHTYTIRTPTKTYHISPSGTTVETIVAAIEETVESEEGKEQKRISEELQAHAKKQFPALFKNTVANPPARKWTHNIETGDATPIRVQGRPHTPLEHEAISAFVKDALRDGIIEPSDSPWSFPLLLVKKADGNLRVCVDFRQLNRVTRKNAYPLPRIDDCYQFLQHARFFTTLDLKSGYWQVQLTPTAAPKTAFTSRTGHYHFKVMPFGLTNAPATFQRMMNEILAPFVDRFVLVYLKDIVIFSRTMSEHRDHVDQVLRAPNEHQLVLLESKCTWAQTSLVYLGHVVDGKGLRTNPKKVEKVLHWPKPSTITDVRGFINLATYYKRFVRNFSALLSPLYDLTVPSLVVPATFVVRSPLRIRRRPPVSLSLIPCLNPFHSAYLPTLSFILSDSQKVHVVSANDFICCGREFTTHWQPQ